MGGDAMRYDTAVYFQTLSQGTYDEETGDYTDPTITEVQRIASVIDTSDDVKQLLYGNITEKSKTISLLNAYAGHFDRIRIGSVLYRGDQRTTFRKKQSFVVSEIPGERWLE